MSIKRITLDEYLELTRDALDTLEEQWGVGMIDNPRRFPATMTLSDWTEQLNAIDLTGEEEE